MLLQPDDNDLLQRGELPVDPFDDTEPMEDDADQPVLLKFPGSSIIFVRTSAGDYVPSDDALLHGEIERHHPTLPLVAGDPPRRLGTKTLIREHGRRADSLVYDLVAPRSRFTPSDDGGGELAIACARRDPRVTPQRSEAVERWLELMVGRRLDKVLDWLATAPDLSTPTAALYLQGPGGVGKGMLASGVAALWGASRTSYADVVGGSFNSALKSCPLVFLDEGVGAIDSSSVSFRTLVGERERPLLEKHRPAATLKGCIRLIIAANNADALKIREDLTTDDEAATGHRVLHVPVDDRAGRYLAEIGGATATRCWVTDPETGRPGDIPRHIAWLEQTRHVVRGSRFLVEGEVGPWLRSVGMRGGLKQQAMVAIAVAASGADRELSEDAKPIWYQAGEALVNPELLHRLWKRLTRSQLVPTLGELGRALSVISNRPKKRLSRKLVGDGRRPWVWSVDAERVVEIAEELGIGDPDAIRKRFALPLEPDP